MVQAAYSFDEVGQKRDEHHRGGVRQKYVLDDPGRNLMRAVYANPEYGTIEESVTYLVEKLCVPRATILKWAIRLGLSRMRDDYWTPEETAYLQAHIEEMSYASLARQLGRSMPAVICKARRLKLRRVESDNYSARSLADALGCHHSTVNRWLKQGILPATYDEHSRRYEIKLNDVREFLIAYDEVDFRRIEKDFLLDTLVGPEEIMRIRRKRGKQ